MTSRIFNWNCRNHYRIVSDIAYPADRTDEKLSKLTKRIDKFMGGKDAKSLEKEIKGIFEDNNFLKAAAEKIKKISVNCFITWNVLIRNVVL